MRFFPTYEAALEYAKKREVETGTPHAIFPSDHVDGPKDTYVVGVEVQQTSAGELISKILKGNVKVTLRKEES